MNKTLLAFLVALGLILTWLQQGCSHAPVHEEPPLTAPMPSDGMGQIKYLPDETADLKRADRVQRIEKIVNDIVHGICIDAEAEQVSKLNETSDTPKQVIEKLRRARIDAVISYYKTKNPWSSAVAYRSGNTLYFNLRQIGGWTDCDFASTALHEVAHMPPFEYDHAFKYYNGRELTVNYWLNSVVDRCCKAGW